MLKQPSQPHIVSQFQIQGLGFEKPLWHCSLSFSPSHTVAWQDGRCPNQGLVGWAHPPWICLRQHFGRSAQSATSAFLLRVTRRPWIPMLMGTSFSALMTPLCLSDLSSLTSTRPPQLHFFSGIQAGYLPFHRVFAEMHGPRKWQVRGLLSLEPSLPSTVS